MKNWCGRRGEGEIGARCFVVAVSSEIAVNHWKQTNERTTQSSREYRSFYPTKNFSLFCFSLISLNFRFRYTKMDGAVDQEISIELRDMVREAKIQTTLLQQEGKWKRVKWKRIKLWKKNFIPSLLYFAVLFLCVVALFNSSTQLCMTGCCIFKLKTTVQRTRHESIARQRKKNLKLHLNINKLAYLSIKIKFGRKVTFPICAITWCWR